MWVDTRIMIANPLTKTTTDSVLNQVVETGVFPIVYTGPNVKGVQEKYTSAQCMLLAFFATVGDLFDQEE